MILLPSLVSVAVLLASGVFADPVQVKLGRSTIIGDYNTTTGVDAFRGLRYANSKRFEHAVLADYRTPSTIQATTPAPACPQVPYTAINFLKYGVTEDCQFLEIYRPNPKNFRGKIPVLVWVHGGGGNFGAANGFEGYNFVKQSLKINQPVIVVSINYRLAAWGLLGGKEASDNKGVNLGLYDQRAALEWVRANIEAFGGDKDKVTLWGQSAGSMNVHFHYLDEKSKLFRAAIMESGNMNSVPALDTSVHQPNFDALVGLTGCNTNPDTYNCLKTINNTVLQTAVNTMIANMTAYSTRPWTLVIDGGIIPDAPSKLQAQGKFAKKPFINGDVEDEGTSYPKPLPINSVDAMWTYFQADYLNKGSTWLQNEQTKAKILELYPDDPALGSPFNTGKNTFNFGSQGKRAAAIYGDVRYQAPRRRWFADARKHGVPAWSYQFSQETPFYPGDPMSFGVQHSTDLLYIFLTTPESNKGQYDLSVRIINHWIAFAYTMNPNTVHNGFTVWPRYDFGLGILKNMMNFSIADTSLIQDTFRQKPMEYLISVQDQFGNPTK